MRLPGPVALADFERQRLRARREHLASDIDGVEAHYLHFVQLSAPLDESELATLNSLLRYGPSVPSALPFAFVMLLVLIVLIRFPWLTTGIL